MKKVLRDLALAFLNATLMLGIMLTIAGIVLVNQVSELRDDTAAIVAAALAPQQAKIENMAQTLESITQRIESADGEEIAALGAEVKALRTEISALRQTVLSADGATLASIAEQVITAFRNRLAHSSPLSLDR